MVILGAFKSFLPNFGLLHMELFETVLEFQYFVVLFLSGLVFIVNLKEIVGFLAL